LAIKAQKWQKTALAGMAHPPKRGKRAQKKGAFGPFRPKKVAARIIWHEFLTRGLLGEKFFEPTQGLDEEPAGQKFLPNDERRDFLFPKWTKSHLLLFPFSRFLWLGHSFQGRFLPFLGLFCQKMSKMGP
jgi:hypothetical protein